MACFEALLGFDALSSPGALEEMSREVLVTGVAADLELVVACSSDGSLARPPSVLERDVLDVVRARCDLAAAAASFACADASRSAADCVCLRGEAPAEVVEEAGEVERIASLVASTESTIDVGLERATGKASRGVRADGELDNEPLPAR